MIPTAECPIIRNWHELTGSEALTRLRASADGLTSADAAARLALHGPNQLTDAARAGMLRILISQFRSVILWLLIGAALVSAALGETSDGAMILGIVLLNAAIGFMQEYGAARSITALTKLTAPVASVRRDGKVVVLPAAQLVEGDVLSLAAGDVVAADARLLQDASLRCVESSLTGESDAVSKGAAPLKGASLPLGDRSNMVFMGTAVVTGTGIAVVVATAMRTELGRIAGMIASAGADKGTPLQQKLDVFGRVLLWAALGIVALLFCLGMLRGMPLRELSLTALSLAVAAVPEGLPVIVTVALSLGVSRMARRGALVRKLAAVETLGATNVICTDKTGTLTVGAMTVRSLYVSAAHYDVTGSADGLAGDVQTNGAHVDITADAALRELATVLVGCNAARLPEPRAPWHTVGDPTEGALLVAGAKAGLMHDALTHSLTEVRTFPFDSDRKRSSEVRRASDGTLRLLVNGAPGTVLDRCISIYARDGIRPLAARDRSEILAQASGMARDALRVLGSAERTMGTELPMDLTPDAAERDLVFVGLSGMYDPPRAEAKAAIDSCLAAGIRVVMITGDHSETATSIARMLGIAGPHDVAVSGRELEAMSDEQLKQRVSTITVYARVTAEHKLRIIRAWKANDAVVAMTGDGVNDAPAIRDADVGLAMGTTGTEVTKQAADIIITDDNFATIVDTVEQGRGIYANIRKALQYLLAGNCGELLLMGICVVAGLPAPLLPVHLLWINLVTDGLPALCLAVDPIDTDVMKLAPRHRGEPLADRDFVVKMFTAGIVTASVTFAVYLVMLQRDSVVAARSAAFSVLVFAELLRAFGARSDSRPIWRIRFMGNPALVFVVGGSIMMQLWSQHSDSFAGLLKTSTVSWSQSALLLTLGAAPLLVLELAKLVRRRQSRV